VAIRCTAQPNFFRNVSALLDYPLFFRGNKKHVRQYVGLTKTPEFTALESILTEDAQVASIKNGIYLEIDIEGWEYRILDGINSYSDRLVGLAIELHDVDLHMDKLEQFFARFPLKLVHVHANNYSPTNTNGIPLAIECTFTSAPVHGVVEAKLPHPLDMPNKTKREEYRISFN
jgi:hypothetical protein